MVFSLFGGNQIGPVAVEERILVSTLSTKNREQKIRHAESCSFHFSVTSIYQKFKATYLEKMFETQVNNKQGCFKQVSRLWTGLFSSAQDYIKVKKDYPIKLMKLIYWVLIQGWNSPSSTITQICKWKSVS